jgi:hypothetical protein
MGAVGIGLTVNAMAILFSALIFLIPDRGKRATPKESFEDSQKRMEQYLREMRKNRGEIDT